MRSSTTPYLFCRICGTRYRSDKVDQHEKKCYKKSQGTDESWIEKDAPSNVYLQKAFSRMSDAKKLDSIDEETDEMSKLEADKVSEKPSTLTSIENLDEEKKKMVQTPYPATNNNDIHQSEAQIPPSKPRASMIFENPKQAWNANAKKSLSAKVEAPKPTKKYRHYPVSCEFCNKKFQPGDLQKHIQKCHSDIYLPASTLSRKKNQSNPPDKDRNRKKVKKGGGGPRFRICYICGRQFGTKSLPIHEPRCLEKWRVQNDQLPPNKRMPEPMKPQKLADKSAQEKLPGSEGYSNQLPDLNEENEAAYRSHLNNLVPCSFCGRKFNPDRIMIHENACIERPKKREYITPDKNEKK